MSSMSLLVRENIILSVIEQTARSREEVAREVDRQLAPRCADGPRRCVGRGAR
jgi:hypothetical protein